MKPAPFVYHAPRTVAEAVAVLGEVGQDGKILAGGQSLIPLLNMRLATPGHLVDINGVQGLVEVTLDRASVRVGALVRHTQLERDAAAGQALPLLHQAVGYVAHPAIRNRGTTVGSVTHADAAAEMPAVLALSDGVVEAVGTGGAREIAWSDFFLGPLETSLGPDELVVAVRFPLFPPATGTAFAERARRHGDYALAGVASAVTVEDGVVTAARLAFVSVTQVPDCLDVTEAVAGGEPAGLDWSVCRELVRDHVNPETDIHATAEYRAMLAAELAVRTLSAAAARTQPEAEHEGPAA